MLLINPLQYFWTQNLGIHQLRSFKIFPSQLSTIGPAWCHPVGMLNQVAFLLSTQQKLCSWESHAKSLTKIHYLSSSHLSIPQVVNAFQIFIIQLNPSLACCLFAIWFNYSYRQNIQYYPKHICARYFISSAEFCHVSHFHQLSFSSYALILVHISKLYDSNYR